MPRLDSLKVKSLKHIAFLTGCATPATKAALLSSLHDHFAKDAQLTSSRVVSVDMGIRNLAYCVLERSRLTRDEYDPSGISLEVSAWNKLDLLTQLQPDHAPEGGVSSTTGLFTPASISKLAYKVTRSLLEYQPDIILIEQQRFRSSGSSAIQEWTVRVNMLESMLWASLEAQRQLLSSNKAFPMTMSASPARVARFWHSGKKTVLTASREVLDGTSSTFDGAEGSARVKITKKDRVSILQGWLARESDSAVSLQFSDQAQTLANRFSKDRRSRSDGNERGKLDDLTDCLLQGAAWLKWEENRQIIKALLHDSS